MRYCTILLLGLLVTSVTGCLGGLDGPGGFEEALAPQPFTAPTLHETIQREVPPRGPTRAEQCEQQCGQESIWTPTSNQCLQDCMVPH